MPPFITENIACFNMPVQAGSIKIGRIKKKALRDEGPSSFKQTEQLL
jgi:hypothetical protein